MCLIALAYRVHPRYELMVAANRDEFHKRATRAAGFWPERPELLAGRDEQAGGTWLGLTLRGRCAAVSNYREPTPPSKSARSRGHLVLDYLTGNEAAGEYAQAVHDGDDHYAGFNLLLKDMDGLWYVSNRSEAPRALPPGAYGLSNHLLDTPWPKLCALRDAMEAQSTAPQPDTEALFSALADTHQAPDRALPDTGVGLERERMLSAPFIVGPEYGTRSSTLLLLARHGGVRFEERSFDPAGELSFTRRFSFQLSHG